MLADALGTRGFRPYLADDVIGAEIGGAIKNVLAIACGIVEGRKLGDNARAALITRGLAEMVRLARREGRPRRDADGAVRPRRSGADLHRHAVAQLFARRRAGRGARARRMCWASASRWPRASTPPPPPPRWRNRLGVEMPIGDAVDAILHRGAADRRRHRRAVVAPAQKRSRAIDKRSGASSWCAQAMAMGFRR